MTKREHWRLPQEEKERRENLGRSRAMEDKIFRETTRGIRDGEPWEIAMAKQAERDAEIEALADSIESTGTVSENPEGD